MIRDCITVTTFIHGQQHNLSNLVRSQVSVNNPVGLQQVVQPVSNNLPQQTFLSTHPVLGNPNTGSVVPLTSENYFAPPTSAEVPSGVAPFVPASTAINHVSLSHQTTGSVVAGHQAPVIPSQQQHMGVPVSSYKFSSDHYNLYSNLWRPAVAAPLMSTQQHYVPSTTVFTAVTPIVPTNNFVPYTSEGLCSLHSLKILYMLIIGSLLIITVTLRFTQSQLTVIHLVQTSSVHFRPESWLIYSCTAEKIISLSGS